jgi:hypothetical protein
MNRLLDIHIEGKKATYGLPRKNSTSHESNKNFLEKLS